MMHATVRRPYTRMIFYVFFLVNGGKHASKNSSRTKSRCFPPSRTIDEISRQEMHVFVGTRSGAMLRGYLHARRL
jgi:hypothetical protein